MKTGFPIYTSLIVGLGCILPLYAAVNVPLTVQEAIYPGSIAGINRTAEPLTVGVPLPDDPNTGVSDVNRLTLSGAAVGQFRVLGRWPSGRIKWVLVDTQADIVAGQPNTAISLTDGGSGSFGGSNLAVDNGATITVNTGVAVFTIRKAKFNGIDQAVVGGTTVVASGSSKGFTVTGPAPGQTICPPCTTVYSSSNDPASTAIIEENGPSKVVIKADGNHVDAAGNVYMHFTARLYFYLGKTSVKITSTLRNADYGASNTFATAYKGHQGYELDVTPALSGSPNYAIANHTATPTTGTLSGTDSVYLYQGDSQQMRYQDWCGFGCVPYTKDSGYTIAKNGAVLLGGTSGQYPQGWADITDSRGVGVEIGVYQLAAYGPKSLEFNGGGSDVRIGIWARENSQPYYQVWPQWSTHDLFLNFHATAVSAPAAEFLKFQHYLVARAPITHYNTTSVFPYPLVDPTVEDNFYKTVGSSANPSTIPAANACCIQDFGTADVAHWPLSIYRFYAWGSTGGSNQTEFRWSHLMNFLSRGMTGRYLDSAHFYRFQEESAWPHSDGFNWRDHPGEYNGFGFPSATSANSALAFQDWRDQEHGHWYGMPDYYFMTGDETIHDALLDGPKDWFLNNNTYQNAQSGGLYNSRSVGVELIGAARFSQFLAATADPDAAAALAQGSNTYALQVKPDLCVSGYPSGCSLGLVDGGPWNTQGVSRVRGIPWGAAGTSGSWCNVPHAYRVNSSFQPSILIQGILEFRNQQGPAWPDYYNSLDLAYGISRWNLSEDFVDDGSGRWDINGFRFGLALDRANSCTGAGETPEPDFQPIATQTTAMTFLAKYLVDGTTDWATKFKINLQKDMYALGTGTSDLGSYQLSQIISILNNPASAALNTVTLTNVADNGGGSYTLSWTVPAGSQSYRIKWGPKQIVDWVGFDPANNIFVGDPTRTMPWFAATNAANIPTPAAVGTTQTFTIATGVLGLTASNFSVKASGATVPVVPTQTLTLVSGSGQTGTVAKALASPFTVKMSDASGNPVSGVTVTFAVTAGGGTLSATSVTTVQGLASTTLTLGPNAGANTVVATSPSAPGSSVSFTATGVASILPPAAKLILVSGNSQTGTPGQALSTPLVVEVTDASGNAVSGVNVNFAVAAGGGTLSSASVSSNASGLASTILTLGANAGANTVVATSTGLAGSPITFAENGAIITTSTSGIAWTQETSGPSWPSYVAWFVPMFDPVSGQTLFNVGPSYGTHGIYSTDMYAYDATKNTFTQISGTHDTQDACPLDTLAQPGDRHPGWQMAVDTKRNLLWLYGGVNAFCSAASGPNANPRQDMYYLQLNPTPSADTWHQVNPTHIPTANGNSAMVYDPDDDVLFAFGYDGGSSTHDNWVFCRTAENPTPGTPTAAQTKSGCVKPDDWNEIAPVGGTIPPSVNFPGMAYDSVTKKVILYGGESSGLSTFYNQTWAYDIPAQTWTQKGLATSTPPASGTITGQPALAYNSATHKILYHQTSGNGSPADWQYDPSADTWTKLTSTGSGAAVDQMMAYDASHNLFIGWNRDLNSGETVVWQGAPSSSTGSTSANACDLNMDGVVNALDVQIGINQALGSSTCGSADINRDGVCNIIDIQRITNASTGAACRTTP